MVKGFWRGGNPAGAGGIGVALCSGLSRTRRLRRCRRRHPRPPLRAALWWLPGRDGGMVVLVEQRDGLVSCGHPFDRVVRIEWRLAGKHRARDRQQAIADTAQSAAVAVTAFA